MKIQKARGYGQKTVVDGHFVAVGLTPRGCCDCLRSLVRGQERMVAAAWYGRIRWHGSFEDYCRADLFVKYT